MPPPEEDLAPTLVLSEDQLSRPNPLRRTSDDQSLIFAYDAFRDLQLAKDLSIELDYNVTKLLGRGSQGVVMGLERRSHRACVTHHALKIFDPSVYSAFEDYEVDIQRIAIQVGVLQRLSHPNLVSCNWMYENDGVGMMLMENIEGLSLDQVLDRKAHAALKDPLAPKQWEHFNRVIFNRHRSLQAGIALYILRKVLRGIDVLHQVGYIHCDIKPSNIMVDRFGTVKLIDFGRAIPAENPENILLGSYLYMAPEVHQRQRLTPQSDLYSAGIVALELLHGGHLIDTATSEEDILAFKLQLPEKIGSYLAPELRENTLLMEILRRLLAVNPQDRFASAGEADTGDSGVRLIHRPLLVASLDTDYGREMESYLGLRLQHRTA